MGQEHTRPFTDAHACEDEAKLAAFSHMVEAAAVGTPADLQAVLKQSLINFRLSRAAFQQLYRARWTAIQEELDQLIAVQQEHELRVLEMNFENGIRSGPPVARPARIGRPRAHPRLHTFLSSRR